LGAEQLGILPRRQDHPVYGLPKVTVKLAIKLPLPVFPRPLRPAI
jgi:hypothetical protein